LRIERICAGEAKLLDHLDDFVHDLDRRIRVRRTKRKCGPMA
jgi:hypothetical protein